MKTNEKLLKFYGVENGKTYKITKLAEDEIYGLFCRKKGDIFIVKNNQIIFTKDDAKFYLTKLNNYDYIEINNIILDDKERKYLSAVIKPFRDKIISISKDRDSRNDNDEYIFIKYRENDGPSDMYFPAFSKGTMYKGMKLYKEYILEELGL